MKLFIFAAGQLDQIGGIQRSYQFLTEWLINKDWDITLFGFASTLSGDVQSKDLAYPLNEKIKIKLISNKGNAEIYKSLQKQVKEAAPDVGLVVNSSRLAVFYLSVFKSLGIPCVYSMRGSPEYCLKYLWSCKSIFDLPFLCADKSHVLMPSYVDILPAEAKDKVNIIPRQIAPAKKYARPDEKSRELEKYIVLYSGRMTFEKQLHYLIDAYKLLSEEFLDWELWMLGHGPLVSPLQERVEKLKISHRVKWMKADNTEEAYSFYEKAHLMVLPSEYEGCPMALREAMAHGLPVVAYDSCSGSNEIIEHGFDGLLASSNNPVEGLVESMRELMISPEKRAEFGLNGVVKAKQYFPDPINEKWEKLLISAVEDNDFNVADGKVKLANGLIEDLVKTKRYHSAMIFEKDKHSFEKYRNEYLVICNGRLFDDRYYLETYLNVKVSGQDPLLHYLSEGWRHGYNPSPEFDTKAYQELYMECVSEDVCPLYHFYTEGAFKGCFPISVKDGYFEKWPSRKPKQMYSIADDLSGDY